MPGQHRIIYRKFTLMHLEIDIAPLIESVTGILADKEILREVAAPISTLMHERIFEKGLASDGNPIGTYNNRYLKLRQKKYKLSADPKVIVVLTNSTQSNWQPVETSDGWGIGIIKDIDFNKFGWVEERFGKKIGELTEDELEEASFYVMEAIKRRLE